MEGFGQQRCIAFSPKLSGIWDGNEDMSEQSEPWLNLCLKFLVQIWYKDLFWSGKLIKLLYPEYWDIFAVYFSKQFQLDKFH